MEPYLTLWHISGSNVSCSVSISIIRGKLEKNLLSQVNYPTCYSRNKIFSKSFGKLVFKDVAKFK